MELNWGAEQNKFSSKFLKLRLALFRVVAWSELVSMATGREVVMRQQPECSHAWVEAGATAVILVSMQSIDELDRTVTRVASPTTFVKLKGSNILR